MGPLMGRDAEDMTAYDDYVERIPHQQEMPPCVNCGHEWGLHQDKYGCQHERGDVWVSGNNGVGGFVAGGTCGCKRYDPMTMEDIHEYEEGV